MLADLWGNIEGQVEDDPPLGPDDAVEVDAEPVVDLRGRRGLEAAHGRALQGDEGLLLLRRVPGGRRVGLEAGEGIPVDRQGHVSVR